MKEISMSQEQLPKNFSTINNLAIKAMQWLNGFAHVIIGLALATSVIMFTWLIAAGDFTHVIAGSTEMFLLAFNGELGFTEALLLHLLPTLAGNIIGGTGLFAMLAYGQIHAEI